MVFLHMHVISIADPVEALIPDVDPAAAAASACSSAWPVSPVTTVVKGGTPWLIGKFYLFSCLHAPFPSS
jgi:hypothetical protein